MNAVVTLLACILASTPPNAHVVEQSGVRVEVHVRSQEFTWLVTNESAEPIMRIAVGAHNTYNHLGPRGWTMDYVDRRMIGTADARRYAIRPGRTGRFQARVTSSGAALGTVPAEIDDVRIEIWAPVPHPPAYIATIAVALSLIALLHAAWIARRAPA
ncbi:MAG: hypothetical protein ACYTGP_04410 [Planctomycetota bacterium]|jgi:hypothetical protein